MTLLSIIQDAANEIGLPEPTAALAATDQTTKTLIRLVNRAGKALRDEAHPLGGWTVLTREHEFTTTASVDEYDLPSDYKKMISETAWDRDQFWQARGSLSPQEWQLIKSGLATSPGLRRRFRVKRGSTAAKKFFIDPTPGSTGDTLVFEYSSKNWVTNAAGDVERETFMADDDVSLLSEDLLTQAVIWRYLRGRGLAFATQLAEYEQEKDGEIAQDALAQRLNLGREVSRLPPGNVPDSGFG